MVRHNTMIPSNENARSGLIWKTFMKNEIVKQALDRAGFVGVIDNFDEMEFSPPYGKWKAAPGKKVKMERSSRIKKDGGQSLEANYDLNPGETFSLSVEPRLKNFSRYTHLGLWTKGGAPSRVILFDSHNSLLEKCIHQTQK